MFERLVLIEFLVTHFPKKTGEVFMGKPSTALLGLAVLLLLAAAPLVSAAGKDQAARASRSFVVTLPRPAAERTEYELRTDSIIIHMRVEGVKVYVNAETSVPENLSLTVAFLSRETEGVRNATSLVVDMSPLSIDEIMVRVVAKLVFEGHLTMAEAMEGLAVHNDTVTISYGTSAVTLTINPHIEWVPSHQLLDMLTMFPTARVAENVSTVASLTTIPTPATTTATATVTKTETTTQVWVDALGQPVNTSTTAARLIRISFATTTTTPSEEARAGEVVAALLVGLFVALLSYIIVRMRL